jgi:hypothetical protein
MCLWWEWGGVTRQWWGESDDKCNDSSCRLNLTANIFVLLVAGQFLYFGMFSRHVVAPFFHIGTSNHGIFTHVFE